MANGETGAAPAKLNLPKTISLDATKGELLIDGVRFGYFLADEPVTVTLTSGGYGTVTVTLMAEHVTIT